MKSKSSNSLFAAFCTGTVTNILNPKAMLFFVSVFSIIVDLNTPIHILVIYSFTVLATTLFWFRSVAIFFTNSRVRDRLISVEHWIEHVG